MSSIFKLNEVEINTKVKVREISSESRVRRRIMDMGIVKNTELIVSGKAPMGDPIEVIVKGYNLSLRKNEAKDIIVEVI